ncbi:MAG: hypothetical protein L6R40_007265 [Gallowayella cf. fulva]|nr:MAG: hypothetical protein L6R40_007265 [Xanthomendoza cf. fulva]
MQLPTFLAVMALVSLPFAFATPTPATKNLTTVAHTPTLHNRAAAFDYEPGDRLNRTMCFCTNDNYLQQTENDPAAFFNVSVAHQMAYIYRFEYYNHYMDAQGLMTVSKKCYTKPNYKDPYWHNDCLDWKKQHEDFCVDFKFPNSKLPSHVQKDRKWQFCYQMRGDTLTDPKNRDYFTFDGEKRGLPRVRDWVVSEDDINEECFRRCHHELNMELFQTRYGGWFNKKDGFHHFDDIRSKHMDP